jgi:hypothetical protein
MKLKDILTLEAGFGALAKLVNLFNKINKK